jgi:1-acyl-sn-glycerol-3-phosphate acyltransferase
VSIGKPIETTGLTPDEVNTRVEKWIETEMRRIDPAAYREADGASVKTARI